MKREFAGVGVIGGEKGWGEVLDDLYTDNDPIILATKEDFLHEEEEAGLNFKYKYLVDVMCSEVDAGRVDIWFELCLVVSPSSLCEDYRVKVERSAGTSDIDYLDLYFYDGGIPIARDFITVDTTYMDNEGYSWDVDFYDLLQLNEVGYMLNTLANCIPTINSLQGFYLDRVHNALGVTGWDRVCECIHGTDAVDEALKKMRG